MQKEIIFIGHKFSKNGLETEESNIEKIKNFPVPQNVRETRSYLGLTSYYRKFVKSYSEIVRPLHELIKKNNTFKWGTPEQKAFDILRNKLMSPPILAYPDMKSDQPLILTTDASKNASGYILSQKSIDT